MNGLLIDLDGVVYQNAELIPGAEQTMAWLEACGIPHLFVTNTTSKPRASIVAKLAAMGIATTEERILTPPIAATHYLSSNSRPVALFVPEATAQEFASLPVVTRAEDAPGAVILGDLGFDWSFERLNRAFRMLMDNGDAELIALGMTRYWRGQQGLQLDVGPFVQALTYATGRDPVVVGKPSQAFFDQACAILKLPASQVWMVGDDAKSDVEGAQRAGIAGIQVKTGKFQPSDLAEGAPDLVLEDFSRLPDYFNDDLSRR